MTNDPKLGMFRSWWHVAGTLAIAVAFYGALIWLFFACGCAAHAEPVRWFSRPPQELIDAERLAPVMVPYDSVHAIPDFRVRGPGDCKARAEWRRRFLARAGWPLDRLEIVGVIRPGMRYSDHVVLVVDRRWVLDDLPGRVLTVHESGVINGYRFNSPEAEWRLERDEALDGWSLR